MDRETSREVREPRDPEPQPRWRAGVYRQPDRTQPRRAEDRAPRGRSVPRLD